MTWTIDDKSLNGLAFCCLGLRPELRDMQLTVIEEQLAAELKKIGMSPAAGPWLISKIEARLVELDAAGASEWTATRQ